MLGNSIRNKPKHRNRHPQDRSTYLRISKCNLFLIPSSRTPPRRGEGPLSPGAQKLAAHPRSGSPLCVPPPAGQVGALMGGSPCAVPCTPRPATGEKAPCPGGMADPLWGKVCARNLFGILCLLIHFADGCLPLRSDQRGAKALLGAPPPPHRPDIHRAYSHFPILSAVVTGAFLSRASDVPTFMKFESKSETEHFQLPLGRQRQVEYKSPKSQSVKILVV